MNIQDVRDYLLGLQARIISALEQADGQPFLRDAWTRAPGERLQGDGVSRLIEQGALFERGGCNFSHVRGPQLPPSATQHRAELAGAPFEALGVSLVLHPRNPHVPTVHMNVRMIAAQPAQGPAACWFGGGMDLTPYYGVEEDARHFHAACRDALAPFGDALYPRYKRWCDEYFYLKHRGEPRGIGGIFYDDVAEGGFERGFALTRAVGDAFLGAYLPIVERRRAQPYGERERDFQAYRRGRYVEFNLVWDRGTHFGLQSGGRTESILMSMPPLASWRYDWQPEPGTPEARLSSDFLVARDWVLSPPPRRLSLPGNRTMRIGLFGGSFDPVHNAHLALARLALSHLALDQVWWIPAGQAWQKPQGLTAAVHRLAMVRLAVQGEPGFVVETCELDRQGPSYTLDTVRELQAREPDVAEWLLILGQDQYGHFDTWHGWSELLQRVTLAVAGRAGEPPQRSAAMARRPHRLETLPLPAMAVSATEVRARAARGEPVDTLVPPAVARYIAQHRLYSPA